MTPDPTETEAPPHDDAKPHTGALGQLALLWKITVDRPVATLMIAVAVSVFGALSYGQLSLALMPQLSYPTLTVRTEYQGAAPEEIEEEISKPIEEILRTVEGVVDIESTSRAGTSDVVLQFHWDTDMDFASQRARERVDVLPLPESAEKPLLLRYDPSLDPILRIGLTSSKSNLSAVRRIAQDELARDIEKIRGVAMVRVRGGREEVIRVDLNQDRMSQLGVTINDVQQTLASENVNLAGGRLRQGDVEYLIRTLNEFQNLEELERMIVAQRGDTVVRLGAIARVYSDFQDREVVTHIQGDESVEIAIYKEADANLVRVASEVKDALFGTPEQIAYVKGLKDGSIQDPTKARGPPAQTTEKKDSKDAKKDKKNSLKSMEKQMAKVRHSNMTQFAANTLPEGMRLELLSDQSQFIRGAIDEVTSTALLGAIFAVFVLYVFLRSPYSTLIIALAIPLSVVFTFAPMRLMGLTLNIMSLGGLALGIGMLVDNSIVVLESIVRCREEGDSIRIGAIRGTQEVGGAVIASTLTTTAVFFPIAFVEGIAGQLFGDLALTVVFSLLASLIVALFVVPMLASRDLSFLSTAGGGQGEVGDEAPRPPSEKPPWWSLHALRSTRDDFARLGAWTRKSLALRAIPALFAAVYLIARAALVTPFEIVFAKLGFGLLAALLWFAKVVGSALIKVVEIVLFPVLWAFDRGFGVLEKIYTSILRGALAGRGLVLLVAAGLFGGSLVAADRLGMELIPELHQGEFKADVRMSVGTNLTETEGVVQRIEKELSKIPEIRTHSSTIGAENNAAAQGDQGEHTAQLNIVLDTPPGTDVEDLETQVMAKVRNVLAAQPGVQYELSRPTLLTLATPIQVEIRGYNLGALRRVSEETVQVLSAIPELTDIRSNLQSGFPEVQIVFQRERLAQYGLRVRDAAEAIQDKVRGATPSEMRREEERLDIVVRITRDQLQTVEDLQNLVIGYAQPVSATSASAMGSVALSATPTATNSVPITLGAVASVTLASGPSEIKHLDGQRAAIVEAGSTGVDLQSVTQTIRLRLQRDLSLPRGFTVDVAGQNEDMEQARQSMLFALILAIFLVYIVMASQFESILAPLVIIFTIPLAFIGVAAALVLVQTPLSVVVFIGLIMLAGIVVNNAIVLVDYILQLRERGLDKHTAILEACRVRLRPVLITTLTTVLGLIPMSLGLGEGAEIRKPMALTVIAGLTSSTLLTLLVIPVVYSLIGELGRAVQTPSKTPQSVDHVTDSPK